MSVEKTELVWLNGKLIAWDEANVHILTHTLHYGLGVLEGIRCYRADDGRSSVFRLKEHVERLHLSAKIVEIAMPWSREQIETAILDTLRANRMAEGYIRPIVYLGAGAMGLLPRDNPPQLAIVVWPWGAYLGDEGLERGIRAKVSSYTRHHPNVSMTKSKTCGEYVNSILAKREGTPLRQYLTFESRGTTARGVVDEAMERAGTRWKRPRPRHGSLASRRGSRCPAVRPDPGRNPARDAHGPWPEQTGSSRCAPCSCRRPGWPWGRPCRSGRFRRCSPS